MQEQSSRQSKGPDYEHDGGWDFYHSHLVAAVIVICRYHGFPSVCLAGVAEALEPPLLFAAPASC